jgi:hypothetical protein
MRAFDFGSIIEQAGNAGVPDCDDENESGLPGQNDRDLTLESSSLH